MTERRLSIGPLAQLLSRVYQPVYAVDAKHRLVWCNDAFLQFFGISGQAIVGQECRWTSPGLNPEQLPPADYVLSAVCPPPDVFAGQRATGSVCRKDNQGQWRTHPVQFIRLREEDGSAVVVIGIIEPEPVEGQCSEVGASERAPGNEAELWHHRLRVFLDQRASRCRLEQLIGTSPAIERVRRQVEAAAHAKCHLSVVGPPGSGRRFVAQAIHYQSAEGGRTSCITLACQVLGPEAVLSTVTASLRYRPGPGELPLGTVILLDAESLPAQTQQQIAEAISAASCPWRLVVTTTQPLLKLAEEGQADIDFASLVSTMVVELPPLAQRAEDIPLLAQHFVEEINREAEKQLTGLTTEALDWLSVYSWPGNVAELRAVITEAHRAAKGPLITVADLPERVYFAVQAARHPTAKLECIHLDSFLRQVRQQLVERALERAGGNKAKAARLLGISRAKLLRLLDELKKPPEARPRRRVGRPAKPRLNLPPLSEVAKDATEEVPMFEEVDEPEEFGLDLGDTLF
ncbi:MAG: PAS domain-containing protein [Thermoguttaceae bacterium]|nr:PAS domain-containing protein [Thermoguttaceae bacterium]MDW8080122.1 helix-turn-helix domain-containing protein [Thermoguttaceae bacterium]